MNEEAYVHQPPGFINQKKQNHVFKLIKALYGLKPAPKALFDKLSSWTLFLLKMVFHENK